MLLATYVNRNGLREKLISLGGFSEEDKTVGEYEKGYNLPVEEQEKKEAENDCREIMEKVRKIYKKCSKDTAGNVMISDKTVQEMLNILKREGHPIYYDNNMGMCNFEKMEAFLKQSLKGENGNVIFYEINSEGEIARNKMIFDGENAYLLYTDCTWNKNSVPVINETFYNRMKTWKYTKKGWLCYDLCVPEPPEVTEVVDSNSMVRVKPVKKAYHKIVEKYLQPIGYQGNNLFSSNWDQNHLEHLDFNGLYQGFYSIAYQKKLDYTNYPKGITEANFEKMLMKYLPVSSSQLKKWAVYDEKSQRYLYSRLGCMNYTPDEFWTSIPEITKIKEHKNGTTTITIDAVCERLGSDQIITHKLTVRFLKNGGIKYLANQIVGEGLQKIPKYQYRVKK